MVQSSSKKDLLGIFLYSVSFKNSGHVTQFAEYLLHILHSISYWIPSMLTVLTLHIIQNIISEKVTSVAARSKNIDKRSLSPESP